MTTVIDAQDTLFANSDESVVIVLTQPGCGPCVGVKSALKRGGVEYREVNIREDERAVKWMMEQGYTGTPVIIDGDDHFDLGEPEKMRSVASRGAVAA
jgi:glutaredoxin-like protein NrdH